LIDFDSTWKWMSVISLDSATKKFELFCKGAPEVIKSICN